MTYEPIWGSIIAWYLFLAGLGGGAFVTSTILRFRHSEATSMIRIGRVIAPIVVIVGLILLMFDATAGFQHPLRFALLLTNFGSVMTWGVVFLGAFTVVSIVALILDLVNTTTVPRWLDVVGAALGICVAVYTGCLLGVSKTFPLWNNPLLPILFLVSAMSTGMAAVLLVSIFRSPEEFKAVTGFKKFHFWLPVVEIVLVAALLFLTASHASSAGLASVTNLVSGSDAAVFWLLFVIVGLLVPIIAEAYVLYFGKKDFEDSQTGMMVSAASDAGVLVGGFFLRLLILVAAVPITMVVPWVM